MANLEIEGRIAQKLNVQSGRSARGEWSKQEFILEFQDGNFTSNAVFSVWGEDKVKDLEAYEIGRQVKVSFGISSREYNGRWYTDLRAWRIQVTGQEAVGTVPAPTLNDMPDEQPDSDDLPF